MGNIEAFIDEGGQVAIGPHGEFPCAARATFGPQLVAFLLLHEGESLGHLGRRLDQAIGLFYDDDIVTDEVSAF